MCESASECVGWFWCCCRVDLAHWGRRNNKTNKPRNVNTRLTVLKRRRRTTRADLRWKLATGDDCCHAKNYSCCHGYRQLCRTALTRFNAADESLWKAQAGASFSWVTDHDLNTLVHVFVSFCQSAAGVPSKTLLQFRIKWEFGDGVTKSHICFSSSLKKCSNSLQGVVLCKIHLTNVFEQCYQATCQSILDFLHLLSAFCDATMVPWCHVLQGPFWN